MSYDPSIPKPTDFLSDSQQDIQTNFSVANTAYGVNHYDFSDNTANAGKHKHIAMTLAPAPPGSAIGDFVLLNSKTLANPANPPQLFYTRDNTVPIVALSPILDPLANNTGYTCLPGNILLQWGSQAAGGGVSTSISFPKTFTQVYQVVASLSSNAVVYGLGAIANGSFTFITNTATSATIRWFAIGLKTDTI